MLEKRQTRRTRREVVAYSFTGTDVLPPPQNVAMQPGEFQCVQFFFPVEQLDWLLEKLHRWFEDRDEIILVDSGRSAKSESAFIVMEWDGCQIDPLFLAILRDEQFIEDYAVYTRSEELYG